MTNRTKSILMVVVTLLIGGIVGALITSAVFHARFERIASLRTTDGFIARIEEVVRPVDEKQRRAIRGIVMTTAVRLNDEHRQHIAEMSAEIDSMSKAIEPLLNIEQRTNLSSWVQERKARERETR